MEYLLQGILIGLLFGLPVGAVGTMIVQRTWNGGIKAGLFTGLGSSAADCFYAVVGVFGFCKDALPAKKPSVVSFTMTPIPLHKKC